MDAAAARPELTVFHRTAILVTVVTSASLYITTVMVASTVLPQMQGAMSATPDEIAWTMTFNIVATAVVTPMTGWLVDRFGRRQIMLFAVLGFTVSTFGCGSADSLEMMVFWRILQGGLGAPLIPLAQAILLDIYPRRLHSLVTSIYGMAIVIGPIIGPGLGGYFAEIHSWRWAYYMIVPVGVVSYIGLQFSLPRENWEEARDTRFDWIGFLSVSVAIACLQLVMARGQRLDWYDSHEIIIETALGLLAFYIFLAHSLTAKAPFLNLKLLAHTDYALGLFLVALFGMLNWTPMVLLPTLLKSHAGFPDALIGWVVSSRGVGALIGFFAAMFMSGLNPRIGMILGFLLQVISGLWLMHVDLNVEVWVLVANGILQGLSVGVIWVPLTVVTFSGLNPRHLPEAAALFHLLRSIGASVFISLSVAEVIRVTGLNYGRMVEFITPYNEVLAMPWTMGGWSVESIEGLARLSNEITRQAAMLGYINAFGLYTLASATAIPLILLTIFKRQSEQQGTSA